MSDHISFPKVTLVLLTFVVTARVVGPAAVWASHQFNDVPTSHPFHDEISAVADAGISHQVAARAGSG